MTSVGASDTGGQERPDPGTVMAELAEAALLGALLWDPRGLQDVTWLEPSDFSRPSHQAIYQTLAGLMADGQPIDLLSLPDILHRGDYHELHSDNTAGNGPLSAYALSELLSTTPASPEYSEHRRYAEIVLEASIRRQVLQAGAHIEHTALGYADDAGDHALEALDRVLDATTTRLAALTRRLGESTEFMSAISAALNSSSLRATHGAERTTPPTADVLNASTTPTTTAHDLSALNLDLPTPSLARLRYAEKALIGGCITEPWLREIAQHRLRPEDFTQPEVAATWLVLTDLVERGEPIDFVLVAAEQQRRGEHPDFGPGLEPLQLRILSMRADVVSGSRAISEVIRGALSRATEHAGGALAEVGANQRQTSAELLEAARTAVRRIDAIRWRLAGKPPPTRDRSLTPGTAPQVPTRADSTPPRPAPRLVPRALPPMPRRVGRTR